MKLGPQYFDTEFQYLVYFPVWIQIKIQIGQISELDSNLKSSNIFRGDFGLDFREEFGDYLQRACQGLVSIQGCMSEFLSEMALPSFHS